MNDSSSFEKVKSEPRFHKMLGELLFTAGVALIAYSFYKISTNHAKYYEQRNLKHRGVWFTVRNFFAVFFGQIDVFGFTQGFYNQFPNEP